MYVCFFLCYLIFSRILQGEIVYEMIGVYPAGSFFSVNSSTGLVSLRNDLRMDSLRNEEYVVSTCIRLSICFSEFFMRFILMWLEFVKFILMIEVKHGIKIMLVENYCNIRIQVGVLFHWTSDCMFVKQ